jgi:hypothetical protein
MLREKITRGIPSLTGTIMILMALGTSISRSADSADGKDYEIAYLKARITRMEQRIQQLRDREAIENLISIYGYYLDKNLWDQVADLFAEDGTIEISQRGIYSGNKRIRESLELYGPQGLPHGYLHNHIQAQPVIHITADGKTAWSRHRAVSQLGSFGKDGLTHGGVYENEYVKENGIWKIKKDHVYTTFFVSYGKGLIAGARGAAMPSDSIPPDLPPSEIYEAFPGVYLPSFHYRHPVTDRDIKWEGNE